MAGLKKKSFVVDIDSSDEFLDGPDPVYPGGKTGDERLRDAGYDLTDLGTLADQMEKKTGRKVPKLPPPTSR